MTAAVSVQTLSEVEDVPVLALQAADSPRLHGEVAEHVSRLIETGIDPPPIVVHRPTMRVIDGMHRLRAAEITGRSTIRARFFDGSEADAFALAVELNAEHGLPLSSSDRTAAAARIVESHPGWSDRRIASLTGLSPRTVRTVRQRTTDPHAEPDVRVGRDGRARPRSTADQRRVAAELIRDDAGTSLRAIARESGISVNTVKDVAERLRSGHDPVPAGPRRSPPARATPPSPPVTPEPGFGELLEQLCRDPSMRSNEFVRSMLRLVRMQVLLTHPSAPPRDQIPGHCRPAMATVARTCAQAWTQLGAELERC